MANKESLRLKVAGAQQQDVGKGIVRVSEETQIELVPEYREAKERELIEVTCDDLGGIKPVVQKVREMIELPLKHPELFDRLGLT